MTMFDPFMTSLSRGWILLAAGASSALVIATNKSSYTSDVPLKYRSAAGTIRISSLLHDGHWLRCSFCFPLTALCGFRRII